MLINLQIKDYLLIDELDLDFYDGLTVITGVTGSGKSITVDALLLVFGAKANADIIRKDQLQASFTATFQIDNHKILAWLAEKEIIDNNQQNIVICRRIIDKNCRSKSYINGIPVNLSILKELGEMLLDIHTQHASIALLKPENQRNLLDEFAGIGDKVISLAAIYREINTLTQKINQVKQFSQDLLLKQEILAEKVRDISSLALKDQEWEGLQLQQKQLANAGFLLQELDFAINLLAGEQNSIANITGMLDSRLNKIGEYLQNSEQITTLVTAIEAEINELQHELQLAAGKIEEDPEELALVDARIDEIYTLARKYRIRPEEIMQQQHEWEQELEGISIASDLEQLTAKLAMLEMDYGQLAREISAKRQAGATRLSAKVSKVLHELAINGEFKVEINKTAGFSSFGLDDVQYKVCFNAGMQMQPLNKVVSGGELSRVALAIYVILSINNPPELIVFDEIDVGIGGGVAQTVGMLLRELGKSKQVVCITHQPQTACCGDKHLQVSKENSQEAAKSQISYVHADARISEVARMLGGLNITQTTLKHAAEMLNSSAST